jgi:hypothetical protein
MMQHKLLISELVSRGRIPATKEGARKWLIRFDVPFAEQQVQGGLAYAVILSGLPELERRAVLEHQVETVALHGGQYDEAAHAAYLAAPASVRAKAESRAAIMRVLRAFDQTTGWIESLSILDKEFDSNLLSKVTLKRYLKLVKDVDPINFAPALLPNHRTEGPPKAPTDDKAWSLFMTIIREAAPTIPLVQAWRDVRDIAKAQGLQWPSYSIVFRRWTALPMAQQFAARYGKTETVTVSAGNKGCQRAFWVTFARSKSRNTRHSTSRLLSEYGCHLKPCATREKSALPTEKTMADHLRLANTPESPRREIGDFIMTETAHDVYRSLDLVRKIGGPAMTIDCGHSRGGEV